MILILDNKDLGYEFQFNEKEGDIIQGLISLFVEVKGEELFSSASLICVRKGKFFFIIKNIYGNLEGSLLISNVSKIINQHLNI